MNESDEVPPMTPAGTAIEPGLEYVVTATLIVSDIERSTVFYRDVLGAEVLQVGEPTFLRLGNIWLTINIGGGPTNDKPQVIATVPRHLDELTLFLNLRVNDIRRFYERARARGASFITEPKTHSSELRCYLRDPDGYLIEVGQTTFTKTPLEMYR
jgi:lactoylglutathione lyase